MNTSLAFLFVSLSLVAGIGFLGMIYPFRPFSSRKIATATFLLSIVSVSICGVFIKADAPNLALTKSSRETALTEGIKLVQSIPESCGDGGLVLNDVVAVNGENFLRTKPSDKADKIKNAKATEILGSDQFHQIDNSTTVKRLCAQSDWTKVAIVTPDWLTDISGWVPNSALREIQTQDGGRRRFVETDFVWDNDSLKFKGQIVDVVNKIVRENEMCADIQTGSISLSPSKSKPNDPVFFVTCGSGAESFNVWFRPIDTKSDKSFEAKKPLDQTEAVDLCESAAKRAAQHPSTVSFSRISGLSYNAHASGRSRVVSSFTAKNSFDLELNFRIDCLFDEATLIETNIAESSQ